ncbi:hypothetical protein DSO57_1013093 [Entomophthora muscae]|uniref:Uncharacterized protein n=1 Tax=Entomophthora muscae TaxID=34485 RepID=A0ACC2T5T1_9FUNG|nr:hypothetical protein DSO57_1013093 [Entomophthora muscae]
MFIQGFFIGIGLNAAAVWSRYRMQKRKYSPSDLIPGELVTLFSEGGFGTEHSFLLLPTILFIFSILNAVFLFTRVREYTLFHADLRRHVDSRGILKSSSLDYVKFTQPEIIDQDEDKGTFRKVLSFVWSWIVSIFFQELPTEQTTSNVLVLSLWNGPMFPLSINIFCIFSPVHVILYGISIPWKEPISLVVLHVIMSVEFIMLTWFFSRLLTDQKILSQELHNEYDQHLVYPQMHELAEMKLREENRIKVLEKARKQLLATREAERLDVSNNNYSAPEEE